MHYVGIRRDYRANANPLRSIPLFRSAAQVFGPTAQQAAAYKLEIARTALPRAEEFYAYARTILGRANRFRGTMRRQRQAEAFRLINQARRELRNARAVLVAAETALLAVTDDLSARA